LKIDTFIFFGIVLPERADLTIQNAARSLDDPITGQRVGDIQIDIKNSQILSVLQIDMSLLNLSIPKDFYTIKNLAFNETKLFVNLSSLFIGGGYDIDLSKGIHVESGYTETIAPRALPIIKYIEKNNKIEILTALRATYLEEGLFIQYAIEDFADALRMQNRNAMFLFYRSIESIKNYYGIKYDIKSEKNNGKNYVKFYRLRDQIYNLLRILRIPRGMVEVNLGKKMILKK
jgi:hypothetical protein